MTKIEFCDIIWAHLADYAKEINNGGDKMYETERLETQEMQEWYRTAISDLCSQLDLSMHILNNAFQQISPGNPSVLTDGLSIGDYTYRIDSKGNHTYRIDGKEHFTIEKIVAGDDGKYIRMLATKESYPDGIFFGQLEFGYSNNRPISTGALEQRIDAIVYFEQFRGELTSLTISNKEGEVKQLVSPKPRQNF